MRGRFILASSAGLFFTGGESDDEAFLGRAFVEEAGAALDALDALDAFGFRIGDGDEDGKRSKRSFAFAFLGGDDEDDFFRDFVLAFFLLFAAEGDELEDEGSLGGRFSGEACRARRGEGARRFGGDFSAFRRRDGDL